MAKRDGRLGDENARLRERVAELERLVQTRARDSGSGEKPLPGISELLRILGSIDFAIWSFSVHTRDYLYMSPAAEVVYGRSSEFFYADKDLWRQVVHPDDVAGIERVIDSLEQAGAAEHEYRVVKPGGTVTWLHEWVRLVRNKHGEPERVDGIARDITAQKQQTREILRLAAFPNRNPNPVLEVNGAGEVTYCNPTTERILGELDCGLLDILPPDHAMLVQRLLAGSEGSQRREVRVRNRWFSWNYHSVPEVDVVYVYGMEITEMREQEQELVASESRMDTVLSQIPDLLFRLDREGRYLNVWGSNEAGLILPREQLLQTRLGDLPQAEFGAYALDTVRRCLEMRRIQTVEYTLVTVAGEERIFEGRVVPSSRDEVLWVVRDITVRKREEEERLRMEEALKGSEERYRQLVNFAPDAIFIHDGERFLFCNPAAARLMKYSTPEELMGRPVLETVHPDQREFVRGRFAKLMQGSGALPVARETIVRADGSTVEIEATSTRLPFAGEPAILSVLRDVSDRLEAERFTLALRDLGERLSAVSTSREAAQVVLRTADELLGWDSCLLSLHQESTDTMETFILYDIDENGVRREFHESYDIVIPTSEMARRVLNGECYLIENNLVHPNQKLTRLGNKRRSASMMYAPIGERGRALGILSLHSYTPNRYSQHSLKVLQLLADYCSSAIVRTQAQDALRENAERYRRAITSAGAVAYERDFHTKSWTYMDESIADIIGYTPRELTVDLWHGIVGQSILYGPMAAMTMDQAVQEFAAGKLPEWSADYLITARDGSQRWLHDASIPVRNKEGHVTGSLGILQDITERKRIEQSLRDSEQRLRFLLENLPGVVWVTDRQLRVTSVQGTGVETLLGGPGEMVGKPLEETLDLHDPSQTPLREHHEALAGRTASYELSVGERYFQANVGPLYDSSGNVVGVVGVALDATAIREAEIERQRLEERIQHAQKLESLGVLAGGIAHDFNNLLSGILGNAGLALLELPRTSPARPVIENIERASIRAADLTRQMLAYSGRGSFVVEDIDLNELVHEMIQLLQISISKKAILKTNLSKTPVIVRADVTQLHQIVMNLITNASDAIGERSGVITITTGILHADRAYLANSYIDEKLEDGYYAFIEVCDTGCGMDKATLARIFDPFFTTKFTGRGLGLAATLGIIRGHRGAIKVYSEVGRGTTFKVLFPSIDLEQFRAREEAKTPLEALPPGGTFLVVDDEQTVVAVLRRVLERHGMKVLTATDGIEAVQIFRETSQQVSAVLLDMTMPRMGGEEAFRELRRLRADIPVILMSGYNEQEATSQFAGKGLAGFLHKPFRPQEVIEKLREVLGSKIEDSIS